MSAARTLFAALLLAALASPCSAAEDVITIPTRSGVTLSYLLDQDKAATPKVVVISFIGSFGAIGLERRAQKGPVKFGPTANFLVRIREQMTDAEVADVIVDSPSDQLPGGMSDRFRLGSEHATDIRALIGDLKQRFPNARIFLLGTSRGTISAAALGASLGDLVQGVVLSSTVTNADRSGHGAVRLRFRLDQGAGAAGPSSRRRLPLQSVFGRRTPVEEISADQRQRRRSPAERALRGGVSARLPGPRRRRRRRLSGTGCSAASSHARFDDDAETLVRMPRPRAVEGGDEHGRSQGSRHRRLHRCAGDRSPGKAGRHGQGRGFAGHAGIGQGDNGRSGARRRHRQVPHHQGRRQGQRRRAIADPRDDGARRSVAASCGGLADGGARWTGPRVIRRCSGSQARNPQRLQRRLLPTPTRARSISTARCW